MLIIIINNNIILFFDNYYLNIIIFFIDYDNIPMSNRLHMLVYKFLA